MLGKDNCTHSNHIIINDAMMHACLVLFVQTPQFYRHSFTGLILGQHFHNDHVSFTSETRMVIMILIPSQDVSDQKENILLLIIFVCQAQPDP